jgi:copper homeostasis protein
MLEIIVETVSDATAAEQGGATQLDLKSDFVEDGLTPTAGTVERICSRANVDVIVMVRARTNGMVLTPDDLAIMTADIRLAAERGADGFLLGAITPEGQIDSDAIQKLQEAAGELPLHFHLAWEMTRDPGEALEELVRLDVKTARTTGGQGLGGKAVDAMAQIKVFREQLEGRLDLLLAGGVSRQNVARLVAGTGLVHAHAGSSVRNPPSPKGMVVADKVKELRNELDRAILGLGTATEKSSS